MKDLIRFKINLTQNRTSSGRLVVPATKLCSLSPNVFSTIICVFSLNRKMFTCTQHKVPNTRFTGNSRTMDVQNRTGFTSPFWCLEFGSGHQIYGTFVALRLKHISVCNVIKHFHTAVQGLLRLKIKLKMHIFFCRTKTENQRYYKLLLRFSKWTLSLAG